MKRYALLLDYLYVATYQQEVVEGAVAALPRSDAELYVFLGGHFFRDLYDRFVTSRNKVYELISRRMFDGVIVCSSVVNRLSADEVRSALAQFEGIPIVFIGNGPDEYHQVSVDNRSGMGAVVRHLIADHGLKKIAFVRGKAGNREAEERYAAYRDELAAAGLPFDPALVCDGGFNLGEGIDAVRTFIDERRVSFDALVASNDLVALGAKTELERRGIGVPRQVALAGFDDSLDAMCVIPSLTTVRQPYAAIAARAYAVLEELGAGGAPPTVNLIPTEAVIRQSCGCFLNREGDRHLVYEGASAEPPAAFYAARRAEFARRLTDFLSPYGLDPLQNPVEPFLDAVFSVITGQGGTDTFDLLLQGIVTYSLLHNLKIEIWQEALSLVRHLFSPLLQSRDVIERAERLFHRARLAISDVQKIQTNQSLISSWKQTDQVSEVSQAFFGTVESTGFREEVYRAFSVFNIRNFLFAEYIPGREPAPRARLVALIRDGLAEEIGDDVCFAAKNLFPDFLPGFSSRVFFVLAVRYQETSLGFVIYGKIERERPLSLYYGLSGKLEGSSYYEKTKELQPLYMSLTRELAKSFYINRLISLEKESEASLQRLAEDLEYRNRELEDFAHVASHDLKEPLRKIAFFSDRLKKTVAGKISAEELDYFDRMQNASARMSDLIEGLLAYSRVSRNAQPYSRVDLASVIAGVLQDLEVRLRETRGRVEVGDLPAIAADPLQMRELFQNLIGNSLKYHRDNVLPVVVIQAAPAGEFLEITVSDNGIGFEQKYEERIFGLFQRLAGRSESDGSGVGLTICKKIVEKHRGTIRAYGEPGRGAKFVIRLPVRSA
jgi:signal transduction histidine kinase/DNA-binding LacI/PurR family transcriptional regulator